MFDVIGDLLKGVATFYAWAIAIGLIALALVTLTQGAIDLLRDMRGGGRMPLPRAYRRTDA